ncbi:hypothetical protein LINPERHAP1_LOCUS19854 [Linum perenne]
MIRAGKVEWKASERNNYSSYRSTKVNNAVCGLPFGWQVERRPRSHNNYPNMFDMDKIEKNRKKLETEKNRKKTDMSQLVLYILKYCNPTG